MKPTPLPTRPPTARRCGVTFCTKCNLALAYCRCASQPPDTTDADARAAADLAKRAKEVAQRRG